MVSLVLRRDIEWDVSEPSISSGRGGVRWGQRRGAHCLVDAAGIEPAASPLQGERSTTDLRARVDAETSARRLQ